jgi:hypothetical protein
LEMGFPGSREVVSGAAIRLKYITGQEIGILCRKRWFIAILDEPVFGNIFDSKSQRRVSGTRRNDAADVTRERLGIGQSPEVSWKFRGQTEQCVGEMIFCVHKPQYAARDPSFGYNI